jgi:hypothetical protein
MGGSYLMTFITSGFTPTQIFYGYLWIIYLYHVLSYQ